MAKGREHTPEQRYELASDARELVQDGNRAAATPLEPSGEAADAVIAALATRANVDTITPVGRMRGLKGGVLKLSQPFLRDQAAFNQLAIAALDELTTRLDAAEARLAELEAGRDADTPTGV